MTFWGDVCGGGQWLTFDFGNPRTRTSFVIDHMTPASTTDTERELPATVPFASIVENVLEGILVVRGDGSVAYMNAAAESLLGRSREQLSGDQFGVPSVARDTTEICVVCGTALRFLELTVRLLPAGEPDDRLITLKDVTSYREDRDQAVQDAERLNRFLAVLSHEIRNPVGVVQSAFELMSATDASDPRYRRASSIAGSQLKQLRMLLDDLLDLSRMTGDKLTLRCEPVELCGLLSEALDAAREQANAAGHSLRGPSDDCRIFVNGDRTRLAQIAGNLVSNAIRYTPEGGSIELAASTQDGHAVIEAIDNGPGLPESLIDHVFDAFSQADDSLDRTDSGLGIGLALVRRIVELHEGTVSVVNRPEGGCCFTVTLPLCEHPPEPPAVVAEPPEPDTKAPLASGRRLVLAEDNPDLRLMLTMMLQNFGYDVTAFGDGTTALEAIQSHPPCVAVLDIGLPGMTGFEVAEAVRSGGPGANTPMLALTGYGRDDDRVRSAEAGFDVHLTKPPDFEVLRTTLETLAESSRSTA